MSEDKPKSIQEALAEVQRLVNETRAARVAQMVAEIQDENIDEGIADVIKGGINVAKNFGRGVQGMNVQGLRAPTGKFGSATSVERGANVLGKNAGKITATAGAATAAGVAAGGKSSPAPKPAEAPKAPAPAAPVSTGPKAPSTPSTTKGGYFKSAPSVSKGDYTVKGGETLGGIAKKHGTSVGAIQSMNKGLTDPSKIAKGAKLNLPTSVKEDSENLDEVSVSTATKLAKNAPAIGSKIAKGAATAVDDIKSVIAKKMSPGTMNLGKTTSAPRPSYSSPSTPSLADKVKSAAPKVAGTAAAGGVGGVIGGTAVDKASQSSSSSTSAPEKKQTFGQAFAAARKAAGGSGGKFTYGGKEYNTAVKGEKHTKTSKLRSMNPKGPEMSEEKESFNEAKRTVHAHDKEGNVTQAWTAGSKKQAVKAAKKHAHPDDVKYTYGKGEVSRSGGKSDITHKVTKEEIESPMIMSFLELMNTDHGNVFEAAKHLSAKQKKIASVAGDPSKIDAEDFKVLRSKKMEEAMDSDVVGSGTVTKDKKTVVSPTAPKAATAPSASDKSALTSKIKSIAKEEVQFSESEIEYINSIMNTEGDNE